jgi:hypothetical protein
MHIVMISVNPLERDSYVRHDVEHVGNFLYEHFKGTWPETAHIYVGEVSQAADVTPTDEAGIERLESFTEPLWVVVYPATGVEIAIGIGVAALIASVAAILLIPEVPTIKTPKQRENELRGGSPNNQLGNRRNQLRIGQRIPSIYGTVKSIPDKLMQEYRIYENHIEQEIGYYCVGEGSYDFPDTKLIRDGDSPIQQIEGASAHVYGPGDAPTGVGPFSGTVEAIGDPIPDPVLNVYEITAVNGQVIEPFNHRTIYGAYKTKDIDGNYSNSYDVTYLSFFTPLGFTYVSPTVGIIHMPFSKDSAEVRDRVAIGDKLFIYAQFFAPSGAALPNLQTVNTEPFDNAPTVVSMVDDGFFNRVQVTVSIPPALTTEWNKVPAYSAALVQAPTVGPGGFDAPWFEVTPLDYMFIGPFFVDFEHAAGSNNQHVICNFLAPNGLFADDGTNINKLEVTIGLEVAPADATGTQTGPWENTPGVQVLVGSDVEGGQRAITIRLFPSFTGRFLIRARRMTDRWRRHELPTFVEAFTYPNPSNDPDGERAFAGRLVDEIRWMNAYSVSEPPNISFGDVTTIHTRTIATAGAQRIRERELNVVCTRMIATWNGVTFAGPLAANADVENVMFSVMKDVNVGNRPDAQIDFAGIANAAETVRNYFNESNTSEIVTRVAITLDDSAMSFEETLTALANMAFCQIYRQGNVIKMKPEIATDDGVGAYNHRNVLPGSMKITNVFGPPTEHDSVEVEYADPFAGFDGVSDANVTSVKLPFRTNVRATRGLGIVGLHSRMQAIWHGYRAYFKMLHQRQSLEMRTTQEGGLLVVRDRVLVANLTGRVNRHNGYIVKQTGLDLILSQSITPVVGKTYTIWLQHTDGTAEGIPLASVNSFEATLAAAPSVPLVTNPALGVPTIFNVVQDDESEPYAYLVSEQSAESNMVFNISAINYSHMYYAGDGLSLWVPGNNQLFDFSPYEHPIESDHAFGTFNEPTRGNMLDCDGSNSFNVLVGVGHVDNNDADGDYACMAWVVHRSDTGSTEIVATSDNTTRFFGFFDNDLAAGHNGGPFEVQFPAPVDTLMSIGVNYRASDGRMGLFLNGKLVDVAVGVALPGSGLPLKYLRIFDGLAGDIMAYRRYWSDSAMIEWHLKTKR